MSVLHASRGSATWRLLSMISTCHSYRVFRIRMRRLRAGAIVCLSLIVTLTGAVLTSRRNEGGGGARHKTHRPLPESATTYSTSKVG